MMHFIALKNKTDIIVPHHKEDNTLFIMLGVLFIVMVIGIYFEIRQEKPSNKIKELLKKIDRIN